MPRFTISHHRPGEKSHYDFFLERDGTLKSWKLAKPEFTEAQKISSAKDHALKYLDFEGALSGDRGEVKIWDTGNYIEDLWSPEVIQVAIIGKKVTMRLRLTKLDDSEQPAWTLEDPSPAVRRVMTALLQEPTPEPPPSKELEPVGEQLHLEESTLVKLSTEFIKARGVEWSLAETDRELRSRIQTDLARWRHPWLIAAHRRAQILDELARALSSGKPGVQTPG